MPSYHSFIWLRFIKHLLRTRYFVINTRLIVFCYTCALLRGELRGCLGWVPCITQATGLLGGAKVRCRRRWLCQIPQKEKTKVLFPGLSPHCGCLFHPFLNFSYHLWFSLWRVHLVNLLPWSRGEWWSQRSKDGLQIQLTSRQCVAGSPGISLCCTLKPVVDSPLEQWR